MSTMEYVDTSMVGQFAAMAMESIEHHNPAGQIIAVGIVVRIIDAEGREVIESRSSDKGDPAGLFEQAAQDFE